MNTQSRNRGKTMPSQQTRIQASTNPALTLAIQDSQRLPRRRNRRNRRQRRPNRVRRQRTRMPKTLPNACLVHYASALLDPVNTPPGACIPYGFPIPSQRVKTFSRGTFQCGTSGKGWITFEPQIANDTIVVSYTQSASVGTNSTALFGFTNILQSTMSNLPYGAIDLVLKEGRVVAAGLRVRYSGTEANRNGTVYTLEEPNHQDLDAQPFNAIQAQISGLMSRPPPDGSWHEVFMSGPVANNEVTFVAQTPFAANATAYMMAYVQGIAGDTYEWEIYEHVEYSGNGIGTAVTTHIDPNGYAKIVETTKDASTTQPISSNNNGVTMSSVLSTLGSTAKTLLQFAPSFAESLSPVLLKALQYRQPLNPLKQSLGYVEEM